MNADGSNPVNISSSRETDHQLDTNPAWSPDGQSIAWNCDFSGTGTAGIICIRKVSDSYSWVQVQSSTFNGNMGAPAWSPDSKKIVFSSRDVTSGPFFYLFVYDLASNTLTKLSNGFGAGVDLKPNWSPDGTKIIYRGFSGLSVINADGSNERDLTNGLERSPKWSLDMKQIAFIDQDFNDSNKQSISVMNVDGTNRTQIFHSSNPIGSFDWQMPPTNVTTPTGASVNVADGAVNLNFSSVSNGGTTSVIPIDPNSAGTLPGGFTVDGTSLAFDVTTTASYNAPVRVCFNVPPVSGQTSAQFFALRVLHGENGVLVDRTISHDFATRTICASVSSLSPFLVTTSLNSPTTNEIDDPTRFVRQHYLDFLGREPEPAGLQGWLNVLNNCPASGIDSNGNHCDRIEVSSDFFRSEEFQTRGYFIYRFYSTLGRIPHFAEFMSDFSEVSGFLTSAQLEANKAAFVQEFMNSQEFKDRYDSLTDPTAYVDALLQTVGLPSHSSRSAWITGLTNGTLTRAQVLRALIESPEVNAKYYNEAFVVMEYFGYLRRDPDILYLDWIKTLNQNSGDYRMMINGFLNSIEYRQRFGP